MRVYLLDLLRKLEELVPPPENCHHAITFARYGSDSQGWEDCLALQVNKAGQFHCFFLDDGDFFQTPEHVARRLAHALNFKMPNEQLGVAMGQYVANGK
jgi:hypothetical protein